MENISKITVLRCAEASIEEKKSVFIGNVFPVSSEEDARRCIESVKKNHYDARHNVFAYILNGGCVSRFTDDGEPKGSAGIPVLNVIKMSGAVDVLIVVTRYFGGILLGTGGLARAYSSAAKAALDAAGLAVMVRHALFDVRCSYSDYVKIQSQLAKCGVVEEGADFGADVLMHLSCLFDDFEAASYVIVQLTAGRCSAVLIGDAERPSEK